MNSQPFLFYQGKYKQLLEELENIQHPSMQEIHNLAIVRFLLTGQNPIPSLEDLSNQILSEFPNDSWPNHPSWNMIQYHISLYYFSTGNYTDCRNKLNKLWENSNNADLLMVLCMSLLSIELFIRSGDQSNVDQSVSFLQVHFPYEESINSFLKAKINDEKFSEKISESVQFAKLRADVFKTLQTPTSEAKKHYEEILKSVHVSPDVKSRDLIPVKMALPLSFSSLYNDDKSRYRTILDMCNDPRNYAILNNKGIHELLQNRYSSSLLYFSKSLDSRHNNSVIYPFHQVIYNIGLSLLKRGKAHKSFKFFHSIIALMPSSPYLWLRLSECCVLFYKQRVGKLRQKMQQNRVISRTFRTADRKFYLLPQSDYKLYSKYPLIPPNQKITEQDNYLFDLNLDFAEKCSRNAIALCPNEDQNLLQVRNIAELICAFVSLELGDGKRAVDMCQTVYNSPVVSEVNANLAKTYEAQGNAMMGKMNEARGMLSKLLVENSKVRDEEQAMHLSNFALFLIASRNFKKAEEPAVKALKLDPKSPQVVLTKVAYELYIKKHQSAISSLKQFVIGK